MAQIGRLASLTVTRIATPGVFLDGGHLGEILMPGRYVPQGTLPGEAFTVFIHLDSEDRIVATPETPHVQVGEFAPLRVVSINARVGAFLDWGLTKDLLLPMREQARRVNVGEWVVAHVFLDEKSNRVVATTRLNRHLNLSQPRYQEGQSVNLLVYDETELGFKCIVENAHSGLLYHTDLAAPLPIGQKLTGYIRTVRPDGKIDLSLDRAGYHRVLPLTDKILAELITKGGPLPYGDKTAPEEIREVFGVSKKVFKQAIGSLFRDRLIVIEDTSIRITDTGTAAALAAAKAAAARPVVPAPAKPAIETATGEPALTRKAIILPPLVPVRKKIAAPK
jgi:predicted RNA-binding protein (virulence factor B family)